MLVGQMRRRLDHQRGHREVRIWDINAEESYHEEGAQSGLIGLSAPRTDKYCRSVTLRVTTAAGRRRFYVKPASVPCQLYLYYSCT